MQIALQILDWNRDKLLQCSDDGEAMDLCAKFLEGIYNPEYDIPTLATKHKTPRKRTQTVQTLIYEAYTKFGNDITMQKIQELRNKHRRLTIRQFDLDNEKTIVKFHADNPYFDRNELHMLLAIIREERMTLNKARQQRTPTISESPILPPADLIKPRVLSEGNCSRSDTYYVDFDTFRVLFNELTPWNKCNTVDLAEKLFRVSFSTIILVYFDSNNTFIF